MPRMKQTTSAATRRTSSTQSVTHLDQLTTEVLRLRCDQQKLPATGSRATLLARFRDEPRPEENMNPSVDPEPSSPISDTASELFAYQQTIRDAQRKFSGMAWYAYDIAFRKKAANSASLSWAQRDPQLYLEKFTELAKTACHACGSADHFANAFPVAPNRSTPTRPSDDLCRIYNKKFPCASSPCPFKHRCNRPGFVGHHPGAEHDERAGESSNSRRER
ncbi:Hypothetical predicted protein [Paramuricea clavata]|uniref:Uncharacterized protein n=1 Tax=Paramuricea clavata TaxID=317549 RepID=A0A6S7JLF9_PARCT|nr:Hypothetical predicted protein [Paramuricea clavata]